MKKNNIRSFRFSDEVLCKLQKAKGDSLNEKFENLVNGCFKKLPQIEKRVKELEQYRNDLYSEVCSLKKEKLRLSEELSEIFNGSLCRLPFAYATLKTICNTKKFSCGFIGTRCR